MSNVWKAKVIKKFADDRTFKVGEVWEITNSFPPVFFVYHPETQREGVLISGEFEAIPPRSNNVTTSAE